jgi:hypothetical protein
MNKDNFIDYIEAVKFGNAMSEKNFFYHGASGIDDEAPRNNPNEIKTSQGILVYRMDDKEIFGYRHTPWIGEKNIRLIPEEKRAEVESELKRKLGLSNETSFSFR